jgi:hypothetical protein
MVTMNYSVSLKSGYQDIRHDAWEMWCSQHVGERGTHWDCTIIHMDYEHHTYTWEFRFLDPESAATFALTHAS